MKTLTVLLLLTSFAQQSGKRAFNVTTDIHPPAAVDSKVQLRENSVDSAFTDLLTIGLDNHIPLGIVIGDDLSICRVSLIHAQGNITVAELSTLINRDLPGYHAELREDVLDVAPATLPKGVAELLALKLAEFRSADDIHSYMGGTLWMNVRSVIAPTEGTVGGGLSSTMVDRVPGMDVTGQTVQTILNRIADKGNGAVWVLHASAVKDLQSTRARPFEIQGYVGQEQALKSLLKCS